MPFTSPIPFTCRTWEEVVLRTSAGAKVISFFFSSFLLFTCTHFCSVLFCSVLFLVSSFLSSSLLETKLTNAQKSATLGSNGLAMVLKLTQEFANSLALRTKGTPRGDSSRSTREESLKWTSVVTWGFKASHLERSWRVFFLAPILSLAIFIKVLNDYSLGLEAASVNYSRATQAKITIDRLACCQKPRSNQMHRDRSVALFESNRHNATAPDFLRSSSFNKSSTSERRSAKRADEGISRRFMRVSFRNWMDMPSVTNTYRK